MTRSELAALLKARGLRLRRSLGQNFLVDANFADAIVRDAGVGPRDVVLEIGAGAGMLTGRLADVAARVVALEIDPDIHRLASELLAGRPTLTLACADGADFERWVVDVPRYKVVSNLPYEPWKRLLLRLLGARGEVESYTLMLQRDVVDRLRAAPGTRRYGPMAALVQGTCELRVLRRAAGALFLPAARVESEVIRLERRRRLPDPEEAERRLQALFAGRRKKSKAAGGRRIETLAPAELLELL